MHLYGSSTHAWCAHQQAKRCSAHHHGCAGIPQKALIWFLAHSCRDSDSGPSTPRSMSTSAASSPLRFASFSDQAGGARMRLSDDGQRRQWARTSDTGSGAGKATTREVIRYCYARLHSRTSFCGLISTQLSKNAAGSALLPVCGHVRGEGASGLLFLWQQPPGRARGQRTWQGWPCRLSRQARCH